MFVVTEADAVAIRTAFDQGGEFSAAVELRQRFPGIPDNGRAREFARAIAAWKPLPLRKDQAKITSAPGVRSPGRSRGRLAAPDAAGGASSAADHRVVQGEGEVGGRCGMDGGSRLRAAGDDIDLGG